MSGGVRSTSWSAEGGALSGSSEEGCSTAAEEVGLAVGLVMRRPATHRCRWWRSPLARGPSGALRRVWRPARRSRTTPACPRRRARRPTRRPGHRPGAALGPVWSLRSSFGGFGHRRIDVSDFDPQPCPVPADAHDTADPGVPEGIADQLAGQQLDIAQSTLGQGQVPTAHYRHHMPSGVRHGLGAGWHPEAVRAPSRAVCGGRHRGKPFARRSTPRRAVVRGTASLFGAPSGNPRGSLRIAWPPVRG